jgi:transketolase
MSLIEILSVLYDDIIKFDSKNPNCSDRDRVILSPGHGCLALYVILADKGFFSKDLLPTFLETDSILGGCAESTIPGVESTTGSLGHGFSVGIGMALASRINNNNNNIFVIIGDGELGEGSNWEAAMCAAKHKLSNITVIIDNNKIQCSGKTSDLTGISPMKCKWESFGYIVYDIDGHDKSSIKHALLSAIKNTHPSVIICNTVMSKGIDFAEDTAEWHWKGKIDNKLIEKMRNSLKGS